ncbi:MAG: hypothetical protein FWB89_01215 [Treponema sp.]|nr:hypothetical protein [Treponema sp.]
MNKLKKTISFVFSFMIIFPVFTQTHTSVSLDSQIYYILEQAELRGLCTPLSGIKPYTKNVIINAIIEIFNSQNASDLNDAEKKVLENYFEHFSGNKHGFDLKNGAWLGETVIGNNMRLSLNIGINIDTELSGAAYSFSDEVFSGIESWIHGYGSGDIGKNISWELTAGAGLVKSPRIMLGEYNTYYEGFNDHVSFFNRLLPVYSQPLTYFPYTYKKSWDGSVHFFDSLDYHDTWPGELSIGYKLLSEISSSFFNDKLIFKMGRLSRDWGASPAGSNLFLNQAARPFFGMEAQFFPVSWFGIATITGFLEYYNSEGIKTSAFTFQNLYSSTIYQFRIKEYFYLDFVDIVVYPKRLELGYIVPIINNFLYQNNIGDFDNIALAVNFKAQYPGLGFLWLSAFIDEVNYYGFFSELDRQMFAVQAGVNIKLPFLSFSSVKFSYTKINPYCYTHNRNFNPWYGDNMMETAYVNNGVSLGYYLPPNSDEFLLSLKTMPFKTLTVNVQYQLIRHGADFGSGAVDGSSFLSELDPIGRDGSIPELRRFFLQDGAYQWNHIFKAGIEWKIPAIPVTLLMETGINHSYFTNITGKANSGKASQNSKIDTAEYPDYTCFIMKMGVKIFPR